MPKLLWPTLQALRQLGGSGTIGEITQVASEIEGFTDEQQAVIHGSGPRTELEYRLAWARTYLKAQGALDNNGRGVWTLTEGGRRLRAEDMPALHGRALAQFKEARRARGVASDSTAADGADPTLAWEDALLAELLGLAPEAFERLAGRLLREVGFISTNVTGQTGDGGIDGVGVLRISLVSFPVFFQCKRHKGSVGAGAVRDFRGAMTGRGNHGLLITTGSFTLEAKAEATRDGAPPVDLIDGNQLCVLLKDHRIGVRVTVRSIEEVEIDSGYFAAI